MVLLRQARIDEFEPVRGLYHRLIEEMALAPYRPGWQKGVYPTDDFLRHSIREGALFVGEQAGALVCAMVLNHQWTQGYEGAPWTVPATREEVTMIHALGILPAHQGQGLAKEMVAFALATARRQGQKAIRLDVLGGNLPAQNLYLGMGFVYICTLKLFYEDTGLTDYLLYEYPL